MNTQANDPQDRALVQLRIPTRTNPQYPVLPATSYANTAAGGVCAHGGHVGVGVHRVGEGGLRGLQEL